MLQKFVNLIALVQAIIAVDPEDYDEITAKVKEYDAAKAEISTFHGDSTVAKPEALSALDDLVKTARAATVDPDDVDGIVQDQDDNAPDGGEAGAETAEDLCNANNAADLRELALKEDVDLGDATTKPQIAAKIVEARAAKKSAE